MHIFLQGPKRAGKSTVLRKTLDILTPDDHIKLGGFFTWKGGEADPHIYMRPANYGTENARFRLASYDLAGGGLIGDVRAFEQNGVEILTNSKDADLIIMDELGFLESDASIFKKAVLDTLDGSIPVFGVLRLGDVEWHKEIKRNPLVTLYNVGFDNRDDLPRELADLLKSRMQNSSVE